MEKVIFSWYVTFHNSESEQRYQMFAIRHPTICVCVCVEYSMFLALDCVWSRNMMPCMPVLKVTLTSDLSCTLPTARRCCLCICCVWLMFVSSLRSLKWKRFEDVLGLQAGCRAVSAGLDTAASAGLPAVAPGPARTDVVFLADWTLPYHCPERITGIQAVSCPQGSSRDQINKCFKKCCKIRFFK